MDGIKKIVKCLKESISLAKCDTKTTKNEVKITKKVNFLACY